MGKGARSRNKRGIDLNVLKQSAEKSLSKRKIQDIIKPNPHLKESNNPFARITPKEVHFENETLAFLFKNNFTYDDFMAYLLNKNGEVLGDYILRSKDGRGFRKNPNITKSGYEIHHVKENEMADLSQEWCWHMSEYQQQDVLVYANPIEHCWAHYLIAKETPIWSGLGWGGLFNHKMLKRLSGILSPNDYKYLLFLVYLIDDAMKERVLNMEQEVELPYYARKAKKDAQLWQTLYESYPFGITTIDIEEYRQNCSPSVGSILRCGIETIYVLRTEQDLFCFIGENPHKSRYYFLSGGAVSKVNHAPQWYFNKLNDYFILCSDFTTQYYQFTDPIIKYIQSIGGTGYLHGLIIDIDYFHHIKIDINNNRFIPYYASSTSSRKIYPSLNCMISNLLEQCASSRAIVPCDSQSLMQYENTSNYIGLITPICEEATWNVDKGFYSRNRQLGAINHSVDSKLITKWETKFDTDEFWDNYYLSLNRARLE